MIARTIPSCPVAASSSSSAAARPSACPCSAATVPSARPPDPKNNRTRSSVLLRLPGGNGGHRHRPRVPHPTGPRAGAAGQRGAADALPRRPPVRAGRRPAVPPQARRVAAAVLHRRGGGGRPAGVRVRLPPGRRRPAGRGGAEARNPPHPPGRAVRGAGPDRHPGAARAQPVQRPRLPHRRRGLLHRREPHPGHEPGAAGGAGRAGAGRPQARPPAPGPPDRRAGPSRPRPAEAPANDSDTHGPRNGLCFARPDPPTGVEPAFDGLRFDF